jgi:hypothetical protein
VAVIGTALHPREAQQLFEYLQQRDVMEKLVTERALEGFAAGEVKAATLKTDWDALLRDLGSATATLKQIFLR